MKFLNIFKKSAPVAEKTSTAERAYWAALRKLQNEWIASTQTLDAELRGTLKGLRLRARDLAQLNDHVRSFLRAVENNVIGRGIPFQSQVRNAQGDLVEIENREIEIAWKRWAKKSSCDVSGLKSFRMIERLVVRTLATDGEVLVRMIPKRFGKSRIPFALQILEADMLDENFNGIVGKNRVRMGVEVDEWQRPVAYHFFSKHPGDSIFQDPSKMPERVRIPAEQVIHLFLPERGIQSRGVPWVVSAMFKLHQLKGYEEASVVRKRGVASIMGFIENPEAELQGDKVEGDERVWEFEPGTFRKLAPGEKVNVPNLGDPGGAEFDPFCRAMLRSTAAGLGSSYEELTKDYSQSSYSSTRQALISDRDNWRVIQDFITENFHQVVFENWLAAAVLSGAVRLDGYYDEPDRFENPRWMPRGWQWVDPLKDVTANAQAVEAGFKNITDVLAEEGQDFEEKMLQRKAEQAFLKKHGIVLGGADLGTLKKMGEADAEQVQKTSAENASA